MTLTFRGYWMSEITVPAGVTASVTTEVGGPTSVPITAGTYATLLELIDQLEIDFDAGQPPSTGGWDFDYNDAFVDIESGGDDFSIAWSSTALRDLLGFAGNISSVTTATATLAPISVWHPDCPLYMDGGDFKSAPYATDLRQAVTPTGRIFGHVGNARYQHRGFRYSHVAADRVWIAQEVTTNTSLERFWLDTQVNQGHAWFTPCSRVTILSHADPATWVGEGTSAAPKQWGLVGVSNMEDIVKRIDEWDGHWRVEIGQMLATT